jgi:hypothetical protein
VTQLGLEFHEILHGTFGVVLIDMEDDGCVATSGEEVELFDFVGRVWVGHIGLRDEDKTVRLGNSELC